MNDQTLMENLLNTIKGLCDLYMHATIESSTQNVHEVFAKALCDTLQLQEEIYQAMSQKGWYQTQEAPQQQITQLKNKFSN